MPHLWVCQSVFEEETDSYKRFKRVSSYLGKHSFRIFWPYAFKAFLYFNSFISVTGVAALIGART